MTSTWREGIAGPGRTVFSPTEDGRRRLAALRGPRHDAARHGVPVSEVEHHLQVARAAVVDSGSSAEELFGTPEQHARQLAAGVLGGRHDAGDRESWTDVVTGVLLVVGVTGLVATPILLAGSGWTVPLTPNGLGTVAVLVLGTALALAVHRWWRGGRLRVAVAAGAPVPWRCSVPWRRRCRCRATTGCGGRRRPSC